jgi:Tfp pilus assembly major pilin PilA
MSELNVHRQRGVTLISLLFVIGLIVLVALLGIKVFPDVQEYWAADKAVKATATDPASRGASVAEIRRAFDKRKSIDNITSISGEDLDITKEGNEIVITFAYSKKIPLSGPVSLVIDFEGSSAK